MNRRELLLGAATGGVAAVASAQINGVGVLKHYSDQKPAAGNVFLWLVVEGGSTLNAEGWDKSAEVRKRAKAGGWLWCGTHHSLTRTRILLRKEVKAEDAHALESSIREAMADGPQEPLLEQFYVLDIWLDP